MMSSKRKIGVNFGAEALNIVETEKHNIVSHYQLPYLEIQDKAEVAEVADQVKLAAILQKTIRDKAIKTDEIIATIPASEILLRSFFIPFLPKREVKIAIDFEARKYVPIKLDLLYFDYILQKVREKKVRKFKTYFIGIKKEVLEKFIYALEQSNLKINSIETSPFSLFRLLIYKKLVKANSNIAIIEAGSKEGNICIIEKGFPQLIRDFKFSAVSKDIYSKEVETMSSLLNKEIRLSFDYYRRQSPQAEVNQIFLFCEQKDEGIKDNLNKEFNIPVTYIRLNEILGSREEMGIGELKAYGAAIRSFVNSPIAVDLYIKHKVVELREKKEEAEVEEIPVSKKSVTRTAIIAIVFILLFYLFVDYSQISGLKNNLNSLTQKRLSLKHKLSSSDLVELQSRKSNYEEQINILNEIKKTVYVTSLLNALPAIIPKGVWLNKIDFKSDKESVFKMEGKAYLEDETEQINSVNKFFAQLKENPEFKRIFSSIDFDYIKQSTFEDFAVTEFSITCK